MICTTGPPIVVGYQGGHSIHKWGDVTMKKFTVMLALICAFAVMGATASVSSASTICTVDPAGVPVRTAPDANSPVIGRLRDGKTFQVWSPAAGSFSYGYAFGGVNHAGYVSNHYLCGT
jgi:hypothetical protein